MKTWKRSLSALLAVMMVAGLLMVPASAERMETPAVVDSPRGGGSAVALGESMAEAPRSSRGVREAEVAAELFAAANNLNLTDDKTKDIAKGGAIEDGATYNDGYFTVVGDTMAQGDIIDNAVAYIGIKPNNPSADPPVDHTDTGLQFTTTKPCADVTLSVASNGNNKLSAVGLMDENGDLVAFDASVKGKNYGEAQGNKTIWVFDGGGTAKPGNPFAGAATVSYKALKPGTYTVCIPTDAAAATVPATDETAKKEGNNDPANNWLRIFSVNVQEYEPLKANEVKISAGAVSGAKDNTAITQAQLNTLVDAGANMTAAGFFSPTSSKLLYRSAPAIEVGKSGDGSLKFVVPTGKKVKVTAELASTGGSNTTDFVLFGVTAGKVIKPAATGNTLADGGAINATTGVVTVKSTSLSTIVWDDVIPGTYYIGTDKAFSSRGGRILSVLVAQSDWDGTVTTVNATSAQILGDSPTISDVAISADGSKITAKVTGPRVGILEAVEGNNYTYTQYATKVLVKLYNEGNTAAVMDGESEITGTSTADGTEHSVSLTPKATGKYTLKAFANDDIEAASYTTAIDFTLPLAKPSLTVSSKANKIIEVTWKSVAEATSYNVYMSTDPAKKGTAVATVDAGATLKYTASGLTAGTAYYFWVESVRGEETKLSDAGAEIAEAAPLEWKFGDLGENAGKGKQTTSINANGKKVIKLTSNGNKFQTSSPAGEGICFYYLTVPIGEVDTNFTLKAKVHVTRWKEDNSQVAFGLLATDYMISGSSSKYTPNMVFVGAADYGGGVTGVKQARIGLGAYLKSGATKKDSTDGLAFKGYNLDTWIGVHQDEIDWAKWSRYTVIGNNTTASPSAFQGGGTYDKATGKWSGITDFIFQLQRNNMGYYVTYLNEKGENLGPNARPIKIYDRDALSVQDPNNIYVGLMVARQADAEFSDIQFTTIPAEEDPFYEEMEYDMITPTITLASATNTNHGDYHAIFTSNVKGKLTWSINNKKQPDLDITNLKTEHPNTNSQSVLRADAIVENALKEGLNELKMSFKPLPYEEQDLAESERLTSEEPVEVTKIITWDVTYKDRNNLYVSPKANAFGNGTEKSPMTLATAVKYVQPGQKIILKEGTYKMTKVLTLPLGTDGKVDAPIYLMADPEATTRPVLDFQGKAAGISLLGDYWYLYNFDVCNSTGVGLQVGGSYNTIDSMNFYRNSGSGMQISRVGAVNAAFEYWPHDNLVWRSAAFLNADAGQTAADGFANKETAGANNVFRDCVSAYNSDDGWDLYAKKGNGSIGDVTIDHCVSYRNGYIERDGKLVPGSGGGNSFKMGGDNVAAYPNGHMAKNCISFEAGTNGFTSNSCPNNRMVNNVAYNSTKANVYLYSDEAKKFSVNGLINIGGTGNTFGSTAKNVQNVSDPATVFVSTTFVDPVDNTTNTIKRDENGYIDFGDFFTQKDGAYDSIFPKVEAIEYPAFSDNKVPNFITIEADDVEDKTPSSSSGDRGDREPAGSGDASTGTETGTETGTGTETTTPETPAEATVEKTESFVKSDGTKVTTATMSDGSTVVTEVGMDGDVAVTVTDAEGEKVVDIDVPASIPASDTTFADVPEDHWAAAAIDRMASLGVVKGVGDDTFDMNSAIDRGSIATMLFRFANGKEGKTSAFKDVTAGTWYADAIGWAASSGVVKGKTDGTFGPTEVITREQLAVMLYRMAKLIGMDTSVKADALKDFKDAGSVTWSSNEMAWCVANGIINGVSADTLSPATTATRAQTAVMMDRFIGLMK